MEAKNLVSIPSGMSVVSDVNGSSITQKGGKDKEDTKMSPQMMGALRRYKKRIADLELELANLKKGKAETILSNVKATSSKRVPNESLKVSLKGMPKYLRKLNGYMK